MMVRYNRI